jgi:hypothetical protein
LLGLEHLYDLWASLFVPGLDVADGLAVVELERIWEGVGSDLGLIVVDRDSSDWLGIRCRGCWRYGGLR